MDSALTEGYGGYYKCPGGKLLKHGNGIIYASSPLLGSVVFIAHGFLSRIGGISKGPFSSLNYDVREGDNKVNIEHHKAVVGRLFGFEAKRLLTINQVHGDDVLVIDKPVKNISDMSKTSADAIITNQYGVAIGVMTADCVPIILVDTVKKVIGMVHAGWKGTVKGVIPRTLEKMVKQFGSDKKAILAAIGPSIGQCCYEVDRSVVKEFGVTGSDSGDNEFIKKEGDGWRIDLKRANLNQLLSAGILEKNISMESICTSCRNDLFFSYRADGKKTGRQLNFIVMKGS